jgi:hypothetical protein
MTGAIFPDCAFPDDCECAKRGYQHEADRCQVPRVAAAAALLGAPAGGLFKPRGVRKFPVVDGTDFPTVLGMALIEDEALAMIREHFRRTGHPDMAEALVRARVTKMHTDEGDLIIEAWLGSTV